MRLNSWNQFLLKIASPALEKGPSFIFIFSLKGIDMFLHQVVLDIIAM
jgi:hypothetical protein